VLGGGQRIAQILRVERLHYDPDAGILTAFSPQGEKAGAPPPRHSAAGRGSGHSQGTYWPITVYRGNCRAQLYLLRPKGRDRPWSFHASWLYGLATSSDGSMTVAEP
jgi:hypothetical protein